MLYFKLMLLIALILNSFISWAQSSPQAVNYCQNTQTTVNFLPQPIFDENEKGIYFFHRWANWLHIKTKVKTLKNESAFFLEECKKNDQDLAELERHLRNKIYIRDAQVTFAKGTDQVNVKTWDNWSLLPTASFGRKGGKNNFSLGIQERNLLGLGIFAKAESYSDPQRSGKRFISKIPLFQQQNTDLSLVFANNDDGKQRSVFLVKDFVSFHSDFAYTLGFNKEKRVDTIFQNGADQAKFKHDIKYTEIGYAWLKTNNDNYAMRYSLGFTQDKNVFSTLNSPINNLLSQLLPYNRLLSYPWIGFEYIEKDFKKLTNIHLISQIEDFNNGWQFNTKIGVGNGNVNNSAWGILQAEVNKGFMFDKTYLLFNFKIFDDLYRDKNRLFAKITGEYFNHLSEKWVLYVNNVNVVSNNQYIDQPVSMGGDTGLRGFPLQYQQGKNSIKLSSELRYYPRINILKVLDLAGVAFVDAGKVFGNTNIENIENNWLYSTGIGVRFYSPNSSKEHNIIHIDLAFPISNNANVNNIELRFQLKESF
ncbi:MAG: hypothetical protein JKX78_00700 [Alteromonadaceae bacterium]|nr:hypothetical protein [Alteromonadaceae bacterium]